MRTKAILIADTEDFISVRIDSDVDEAEAREIVGLPGTYHKRANGLWIIVKDN